jgi:hypothetical protein
VKGGGQLKPLNVKSYPQTFSTGGQNLLDTPKPLPKLSTPLTRLLRYFCLKQDAVADILQKRKSLMGALYAFLALLSISSQPHANAANYSTDHLRLYAHSRILIYDEFKCFDRIITKESHWNYKARNKSHWGLGQMKSKHYGTLDPFRQIDSTIKYITIRYQTPCKAWAFHQKRNYF